MAVNAQRRPVYLPRADDPISAEWTELAALFPFCFSILTTAKDWQDTLAAQLPSYRERIVQVRLASDTGGLNLDMDQDHIKQIIALGKEAGEALEYYPKPGFPYHQWVRYQVLMGQLEKQLQDMRETPYPTNPLEFRVDYAALGDAQLTDSSFPYPRPQDWLDETNRIMAALKCLVADWQPQTFSQASPLPEPTLRVTPDI